MTLWVYSSLVPLYHGFETPTHGDQTAMWHVRLSFLLFCLAAYLGDLLEARQPRIFVPPNEYGVHRRLGDASKKQMIKARPSIFSINQLAPDHSSRVGRAFHDIQET